MVVVAVITVAIFSAVWSTIIDPVAGAISPVGLHADDSLLRPEPLNARLDEAACERAIDIFEHWSRGLASHRLRR